VKMYKFFFLTITTIALNLAHAEMDMANIDKQVNQTRIE